MTECISNLLLRAICGYIIVIIPKCLVFWAPKSVPRRLPIFPVALTSHRGESHRLHIHSTYFTSSHPLHIHFTSTPLTAISLHIHSTPLTEIYPLTSKHKMLAAKRMCIGVSCINPAGTLQCPTCLKLGKESFFCSQDCFKNSWVRSTFLLLFCPLAEPDFPPSPPQKSLPA